MYPSAIAITTGVCAVTSTAVFNDGMSFFSEDSCHADRGGEEFATLADGGGVLIGEGICIIEFIVFIQLSVRCERI